MSYYNFKYPIGDTIEFEGKKVYVWGQLVQEQLPGRTIEAWYRLGDKHGKEVHFYYAKTVEGLEPEPPGSDCPIPPGPPC
jgi:hypothetical protein